MPTYQYACTSEACGLQFERVQSFTDNAITDCPDCSGRVRKVYGSVGVVFKGSGFYRTDNRDDKAAAAKSGSSSGSSSSDSSSSSGGASGGSSGTESGSSKPTTSAGSESKAPTAAAS